MLGLHPSPRPRSSVVVKCSELSLSILLVDLHAASCSTHSNLTFVTLSLPDPSLSSRSLSRHLVLHPFRRHTAGLRGRVVAGRPVAGATHTDDLISLTALQPYSLTLAACRVYQDGNPTSTQYTVQSVHCTTLLLVGGGSVLLAPKGDYLSRVEDRALGKVCFWTVCAPYLAPSHPDLGLAPSSPASSPLPAPSLQAASVHPRLLGHSGHSLAPAMTASA